MKVDINKLSKEGKRRKLSQILNVPYLADEHEYAKTIKKLLS